MTLPTDPKYRRLARLFEYRRQQSVADSTLQKLQRRKFVRATPQDLSALRETAAHSLTRFR